MSSGPSWVNVAGGNGGGSGANASARGRPRGRVNQSNANPGQYSSANGDRIRQSAQAQQVFQGQPRIMHEITVPPPLPVLPISAWKKPIALESQPEVSVLPKNSVWGRMFSAGASSNIGTCEQPQNNNSYNYNSFQNGQTIKGLATSSQPPAQATNFGAGVHEQLKNSSYNASNVSLNEKASKMSYTTQPQASVPNVWAARAVNCSLNISAPIFRPSVATSSTSGTVLNAKVQENRVFSSTSSAIEDPRASSVKVDQLVVVKEVNPKLHMLGIAENDQCRVRPMRPKEAPGSGKTMSLIANHFQVNLKNVPTKVYHYDVVITPKEGKERNVSRGAIEEVETTIPDRLLPEVWKVFEESFHGKLGARMPFDGKKNCYTAKPLRLGMSVWSDEIKMVDPDDGDKTRTFRIQLKLANEVRTESMWTYLKSCDSWERCELPQEVIQALDVALRYRPMNKYTPCNRSFFNSEKPYAISDLLELWYGHNQSLLLGRDSTATLNIDMANKAFVKKMSVVKLMKIILNKEEGSMDLCHWTDKQLREAEIFLKGKLVQYGSGGQFPDGTYKKLHRFVAVKIVKHDCDSFTFHLNGNQTSIREHFLEKGVNVKHPKWPVVHIGNKNMTNFVPLELCEVLPQAYKGKLEAEDTSRMIRGAATEPKDRFDRITKSRIGCEYEQCPALMEFGMKVDQRMIEINTARKLPPPRMMLKDDSGMIKSDILVREDGKFSIGKFIQGAKISKIGILNASGKNSPDFVRKIKEFARSLGVEAELRGLQSVAGYPQIPAVFADAQVYSVHAKLVRGSQTFNIQTQEGLRELKSQSCQLVLVIMSRDGKEYSVVKSEAEVQVGILTQCIREETVFKVVSKPEQARQILINVLLKINAKLNGVSFQLSPTITNQFKFTSEPILFLGADVTHPAPNSKSPSVAAVTASYDISGMCYSMHIQVQAASQEHIDKMVDVVRRMICEFRDKTRVLPKRIMMFRDGVSEGQFPQIKDVEYKAIKEACGLVQEGYTPKITFLIVKKRHHTRFRPVNQRDAVRPKGNIPPGTVVDTVITHPTEMEFFLNSHVGIQGTSKPTRYHVLHDDSNFTMDELERLTYYLCYTFVRCTHPVSVPCVTYYAHIAAFRARALIEKEGDNVDLKKLQERMTVKPELLQRYPMFYV